MSAEDETKEGATRRRGSDQCKALLDAATPELYQQNAFRITGLPVDASQREISKHADTLKMMEELGHGHSVHAAAFALRPPPTVDQIREAIQKLKDPEQRVVDEFFWFWPRQFGKSAVDPAIQALSIGDSDTALRIWTAMETNPNDGSIAMHNLAVLWHLTALEAEGRAAGFTPYDDGKQQLEKCWRNAFKRWEHLAVDDLFWEVVSSRIKQVDDARLTTGFVRRMRGTLPGALDKINAQLAIRHAESGRMELARLHVQFMRETHEGLDDVNKTAETVLSPATARLKQQIERAQQRAKANAADALIAATELLDHAHHTLFLFDLFFGQNSDFYIERSDEVAALCNQLQVSYHKATDDNAGCFKLLNSVLPLAITVELRQQIEKNIRVLTDNLASEKHAPIYELLKELQDSDESPSQKLETFRSTILSLLASAASGGKSDSVACSQLFDGAARVLRGISLDAWNESQNLVTAEHANELACTYAKDSTLKQQLLNDQKTIRNLSYQAPSPQKDTSPGISGGCMVVIGLIVLFGIIGSCNRNTDSTPSRSYEPPATPSPSTYRPPAPSGNAESGRYRVPSYIHAELARDSQAIETERSKATLLASQADSLSNEIEREGRLIDRTSQASVDEFNRKVARYNSMIEDVRVQNRLVNQMVDNYNAKLRQHGR